VVAVLAAFQLALTAAAGVANTPSGVLEVRIKDHREAIGDFSRFTIRLQAIAISPEAGLAFWKTGWRELAPAVASIDLTRYTGGDSVAVFSGAIDAGPFDAVRVDIASIEAVKKKDARSAAVKNLLSPIKLPGMIERDGKTVVVIDLVVLDMSDHPPRGYELAIRGYELFVNGKLRDKVPPA
jgi:hypothetical protein